MTKGAVDVSLTFNGSRVRFRGRGIPFKFTVDENGKPDLQIGHESDQRTLDGIPEADQ